MTIFQHAPVTWTADTICDADALNTEIKEKLDDIDDQFPVGANGLSIPDDKDIAFASGAKMERVDGHIVLTPEADKLIKIASARQDIAANTYLNNIVVQHGWGFILGLDAQIMNKDITFPIAFTNTPVVVVTYLGTKTAHADPTAIGEFDLHTGGMVKISNIVTTGFKIYFTTVSPDGANPDNFLTTHRYGFSWIAVGQV